MYWLRGCLRRVVNLDEYLVKFVRGSSTSRSSGTGTCGSANTLHFLKLVKVAQSSPRSILYKIISSCRLTNIAAVQYRHYSTKKEPQHWQISGKVMESSDWLDIDGRYKVCPWALSGVESCVVVVGADFTVAFDMGYAYPSAVKCKHVFISHGHMDHVSAVVSHAAKRGLYSMPPATYYVPPHLVEPLNQITKAFSEMNADPIKLKLHPVSPGETVHLPGGIKVKAFATIHRVPSQGYIVYSEKKTLRPEYQGRTSAAIGDLVKGGEDIFYVVTVPEVAYTGDTMSDIFHQPQNPDLLKVNLLITESTYLDNEDEGKNTVAKARERGHMHIDEIIQNEQIFVNVKNIILLHFSDKYSTKYIKEKVNSKLPETLKKKVHLGLVLKEKFFRR